MPYKDIEQKRLYNKERLRQIREKKYVIQDANRVVVPKNEIYYYEHSGKPITMTPLNGQVIYLKRRTTTHI